MEKVIHNSDRRAAFYKNTVRTFIKDNKKSVLIVAGTEADRNLFLELGFDNVVISNLDLRINGNRFHPYKFAFQDVHNLAYKNNSFDYTIIQGGLHHCYSPHRALLEMYRVAKIGILAIESRDSFFSRLSKKLKITETYEIEMIMAYPNAYKFGGVNNTEIPNYIYRWNENEVEKTISSFAPYAKHEIKYKYGFSPPTNLLELSKNTFSRIIITLFISFLKLFLFFIPKQQNLFAFFIKKPTFPKDLFPWISINNGKLFFNKKWAERRKQANPRI